MKNILILIALISSVLACTKNGPYDEFTDPRMDIQQSLIDAKASQLPLIIIFGANWCPDCLALNEALTTGPQATKISSAFKFVKVNVGNFDANLDVASDYGNPIQGGIPGAALLSSNGELIYVTKPGELANARKNNKEGLYYFFDNRFNTK
jgi:thioredoxin